MDDHRRAQVAWKSVEEKMRLFAPELLARLPPPATGETIGMVENALRLRIPKSALAVYRQHDGLGVPAVSAGMCQSSYLLSLSDALDAWRSLRECAVQGAFSTFHVSDVAGPIHQTWWHEAWLPVTADGGGNHYCIDLDPPPGGTPGQVVGFWHADGDRAVFAPDLATLLTHGIDIDLWEDMLISARTP